MTQNSTTYDIALVLDAPAGKLERARDVLQQISSRFAKELLATDVMFLEPSLVVCLLHFDPVQFAPVQTGDVALSAREGGFRILKPMLLSAAERKKRFDERFSRLHFCELAVTDINAVFDALGSRIDELAREGVAISELRFTLRFSDEDELLACMSTSKTGAITLSIPSRALPSVGATLAVAVTLDSGQGPLHTSARVTDASSERAAVAGFSLELTPSQSDLPRLEEFMTAVRGRRPWNSRSAPKAKRHSVRLPIEYDDGEQRHKTFTSDISRGGAYVETLNAPAVGTALTFELFAVGHTQSVVLRGRVTHVVAPSEAADRGQPAGFGVNFTEHADKLRAALEKVIGSIDIPVIKRAMVVDDERFFRVFFGNILNWAGFETLEAEDGKKAYDRLLDELVRLDLLVLDLNMPGMSGAELIQALCELGTPDTLAIVIVSGAEVSAEERLRLTDLGADDILDKKTPPEEILRRIEAVMQRKVDPSRL